MADDVDHYLTILEHPVPVGDAIDPHGGLVRAHHAGPSQMRQDGANLGIETRLGALKGGIQGAFTDGKAEQFQQ